MVLSSANTLVNTLIDEANTPTPIDSLIVVMSSTFFTHQPLPFLLINSSTI
jgi:hypothetical protein